MTAPIALTMLAITTVVGAAHVWLVATGRIVHVRRGGRQ